MDGSKQVRDYLFYKTYFQDFLRQQLPKVRAKITWTLGLIQVFERVPETYLKHVTGTNGLYEIRVQHGGDIFRIFCFFHSGKLIILSNGFQKKTQKTPPQEITKALKIKQEYEDEKSKSDNVR